MSPNTPVLDLTLTPPTSETVTAVCVWASIRSDHVAQTDPDVAYFHSDLV